jgi:hypothetical protein
MKGYFAPITSDCRAHPALSRDRIGTFNYAKNSGCIAALVDR